MSYSIKCLLFSATMFAFVFTTANAQVGVLSEEEQIRQAEHYFKNKNYDRALPLFSQIVSKQPEQPFYNYCMGVCLLKVDGDKADAVRFLTTSIKSTDIPMDAWFYLGISLHRAYRYDEAISMLEKYKLGVSKEVWTDSGGEQLITMCNNALNITNDLSLTRHSIKAEEEVSRSDFHTLYKDMYTTGRFLKLPKDYEQKQTKGTYEGTLLFLNAKGNMMVYTAPSVSGLNGLDIFKVEKDQNGLWMSPEPISNNINTPGDEAYPVLVNNGETLYFSSKGSNSTGGYDVFKSEYNPTTHTWLPPVSMGTPVNSPGDDFYYVPMIDQSTAYFSSDREAPSGKCKVYTASVIQESRKFVAIDGSFLAPAGLENSDAKITILNAADRSLMAQFRTNAEKGIYLLKLPVPSELIFQVRMPGFNDMETKVELSQTNADKLFQEIMVSKDLKGKETVVVTNRVPEISVTAANSKQINSGNSEIALAKRDMNVKMVAKPDEKMSSQPVASLEKKPIENAKTTTGGENKPAEKNETVAQNMKVQNSSETQPPLISIINTEEQKNAKAAEKPVADKVQTTEKNSNVTVKEDVIKNNSTPVTQPNSIAEPTTASVNSVSKSDKDAIGTQTANTNAIASTEVKSGVDTKAISENETNKKLNQPEPKIELVSVVSTETKTTETSADQKSKTSQAITPVSPVQPEKQEIAMVTPASDKNNTAKVPVEIIPVTTTQQTSTETQITQPVVATTETISQPAAEVKEKAGKKSKRETPEEINAKNLLQFKNSQESANKAMTENTEIATAPKVIQNNFQDVTFKVQLGAFCNRKETDLKKKFESLGLSKLEYMKNEQGYLVVLTGSATDYASATQLKESAINQGVKDAFIVVYSGEKQLPISMVVEVED